MNSNGNAVKSHGNTDTSLADDAVPTVHVDVVHEEAQGARVDSQRGRLKEKEGNSLLDLRRLGDTTFTH